ncbi:hypothetical protein [Hymenobacter sp. BT559]|uniref:hypothetical protein n=1 Tax=Hymenobacter sp. BT559 TaxID=2795729 RepID=UPI0018EA8D9B|nr:hypothetical protein [Hymenobacter sp. BT559]MBJ6141780.1 hypothetical protein [Hymenobacter sp. BT559]
MLPAYILADNEPPPAAPLTLTVTAGGRVYLSKALLRQLGVRAGQLADLLPPTAAGTSWQLDLRPTAARRINWHANTCPRLETSRPPAGLVPPGTRLTLALVPTEATGPGLYQLTPLPAPTAA